MCVEELAKKNLSERSRYDGCHVAMLEVMITMQNEASNVYRCL